MPTAPVTSKTTAVALGADVATALYGVTGAGQNIGIISDSFNAQGGYATDVANGIAPANVDIVSDATTGSDEGRAMLELAYSIAPGASYSTAEGNADGLGAEVTALKNAGATIIADDLSVGGEGLYQNGSATDVAISAAVAANVDYFTSAGNNGNAYYEQGFVPLATTIAGIGDVTANNFGSNSPYLSLTITNGSTINPIFQFAQPFKSFGTGTNSPTNSLAIYLLDASGAVVALSTVNDVGGDPTQSFSFKNTTSSTTFRLVVVQNGGTVPAGELFKLVLEDGGATINNPNAGTGSGDLLGHELLPGVNSVGAVNQSTAPANGGSPTVEGFSSVGPGTILFDNQGNPLATPITVGDPQFDASDATLVGSANTNFATSPFFGTSAAAPSAAAVAALILQADPTLSTTQVTSLLLQTVIPVKSVNSNTGAGLIQARAGVEIGAADAGDRWTNVAGGNWTDATSWSTGAVPTSALAVGLSDNLGAITGSYTVTVNTSGDVAGSIAISAPAGSSATLNVTTGGTLTIGPAGATNTAPTATDITSGDLLVSDNGTLNVTGGTINETGSLNVNNGTVTVSLGSVTANNYAENAGLLTVGGGAGAAGLTLTGLGFAQTGGMASIANLGTLTTSVFADSEGMFATALGGTFMDSGTASFTNNAIFNNAGQFTDTGAASFLTATITDSGSFIVGSATISQSTFNETGSLFTTGALNFDDTGATVAANAMVNAGSLGVGATLVGFSSTLTIAGKLTDAGGLGKGSSGGHGSIVLQTGGELDVGGTNNQVGITFAGNGLLAYTSSDSSVLLNEGGFITGLAANNGAIDFTGLTYNAADTLAYFADNGQVDVDDPSGTAVARVFLDVGTNYTGLLRVQSDGATNHAEVEVVCFASGTLIQTVRGEIAVEDLAIGDRVVTMSGEQRPIRWLGHRSLDCRSHARPETVHPIRIARHAFGENRPAQDLYVSPGHSICIDVLGEVLIPACALTNGSTITQIDVDQITYWHVELDSHDILIANGLPAESYLDMGNKSFFVESDVIDFDMSPDVALLDPAKRTAADFCRPCVTEGPILNAIRMQLRRRAETMGWTLDTSQPLGDLHLIVDGLRIDPVLRGLIARFMIPAGAGDASLVSMTARPCDVTDGIDPRPLGVCLTGLTIDNGFDARTVIALDDPLLGDGLHDVEDGRHRWTTGRAHLPAALWDQSPEGFFLLVEIAGPALPRWVKTQKQAVAAAEQDGAQLVKLA